jgi:hypothetical protein
MDLKLIDNVLKLTKKKHYYFLKGNDISKKKSYTYK